MRVTREKEEVHREELAVTVFMSGKSEKQYKPRIKGLTPLLAGSHEIELDFRILFRNSVHRASAERSEIGQDSMGLDRMRGLRGSIQMKVTRVQSISIRAQKSYSNGAATIHLTAKDRF